MKIDVNNFLKESGGGNSSIFAPVFDGTQIFVMMKIHYDFKSAEIIKIIIIRVLSLKYYGFTMRNSGFA